MKIYLYMAAGVALIFAVWGTVIYLEHRGAEQERKRIEKENTNAGNTADKWRDEYRACTDINGVYHFDAGKCERAKKSFWGLFTGD
jgi:hypothetical protein